MDFANYTHCIAVRCLVPQEYEEDERTTFMRHFEWFLLNFYQTASGYAYTEITEETDDEGVYFDFTIWTEMPLDDEDDREICSWKEVLNAHLNINCEDIEIFP